MSRLIATEHGRVLNGMSEEITRWRWAKKEFRVPAGGAGAAGELWVFVHAYPQSKQPLHVLLNGKKLGDITPPTPRHNGWLWLSIRVPKGRLRAGVNSVVLHSDNEAMNAWVLGLEAGRANAQNAVSYDAGKTWRSDGMGLFSSISGQYIIRLRLDAPSLRDPKPPAIVYESADHPRVKSLLAVLPKSIVKQRDPWKQIIALQSWVSQSWTWRGGTLYAPWDPLTILDWGKNERGHGWSKPVTFCVHFGTTMAAFAAALGHRARGVAVSGDLNTHQGHFMIEVWSEKLAQWVLHDPTMDTHFECEGRPLSLWDLIDIRHTRGLSSVTPRTGPAHRDPFKATLETLMRDGKILDLAGVWLRNDYVSDPSAGTPSHGHVIYCETQWVWYLTAGKREGLRAASMFPYRTSERTFFDAAPPGKR